jgi:hypothetical protein
MVKRKGRNEELTGKSDEEKVMRGGGGEMGDEGRKKGKGLCERKGGEERAKRQKSKKHKKVERLKR